jgi:hypothetical protein
MRTIQKDESESVTGGCGCFGYRRFAFASFCCPPPPCCPPPCFGYGSAVAFGGFGGYGGGFGGYGGGFGGYGGGFGGYGRGGYGGYGDQGFPGGYA